MYRPVLVSPPAALPIALDDAKLHCRVDLDNADDDALITALIGTAVSYLDGWTGILGRCLMPQTWRQDFDGFARCLRLPLAPIEAIATVSYLDAAGAAQTVDPGAYTLRVDGAGSYVRFASVYGWPSISAEGQAVSVTFDAGYPLANSKPDIPLAIRQAMLLLIGHWYDTREAVNIGNITTALPLSVDALLAPFRRARV